MTPPTRTITPNIATKALHPVAEARGLPRAPYLKR